MQSARNEHPELSTIGRRGESTVECINGLCRYDHHWVTEFDEKRYLRNTQGFIQMLLIHLCTFPFREQDNVFELGKISNTIKRLQPSSVQKEQPAYMEVDIVVLVTANSTSHYDRWRHWFRAVNDGMGFSIC